MIDALKVNETAGMVSWRLEGREVQASCPAPIDGTAVFFKRGGFVGVLSGKPRAVEQICCFHRETGALLFQIDPPEGWSISHLTNHPDAEAAVVCGAREEKVGNFWDWHFAINPKDGSLKRISPAY